MKFIKIPKFVEYADNTFIFKPADPRTDLGQFKIEGYLTDSNLQTPFSFNIFVFNLSPKFKTVGLSD